MRCTQERSQLQNKEKAMALLMAKLLVIAQEQRASEIADIRGDIVEAAWGNQIRNYVFHPYQMVKDLRSGQETTDVQAVMDGDLDPFIQSLLHQGVEVAVNEGVTGSGGSGAVAGIAPGWPANTFPYELRAFPQLHQAGHAKHGAQGSPEPGALCAHRRGAEHFSAGHRLAGAAPDALVTLPTKPPRHHLLLDLAFVVDEGLSSTLLSQAGPLAAPAEAENRWLTQLSRWLEDLAPELPAPLQASTFSLGLRLTDDPRMAGLNQQWRGSAGPTDVLAFAAQEEAPPLPGCIEPLELGDIIISLDTAARQATDAGQELAVELLFLASHGLLHLLGWDHPDQAGLEAMLERQERLIQAPALPTLH